MTRRILLLTLILALGLTACGAPTATQAPMATEAPAPTDSYFEMPVEDVAATSAPAATAAPVADSAPGSSGQLAFAASGSKMVIKDATMELLVKDSQVALARVTQLTADVGGYIISSQTWYQNGFMFASLRLGIPSTQFENALITLRGMALQVIREDAQGQDVSAEYVDLQSQLTNLEATAARVREFLADAKTVEESLRISKQLAELDAQIEKIKGQMRFYEGRAAFSTVTVVITPEYPTPTPTLTPTPTATPTATPGWNPGGTFTQASGVLVGASQNTIDVLIWLLVVVGPFAIIIGVLVFIVSRFVRRKQP
jgi:hypothetical protein